MNKQNGSALIISLLMLLVMTLLGITSMSTSTLEEKMAANDRNQKVSFQNAELTQVDAEDFVLDHDFDIKEHFKERIVDSTAVGFYDIGANPNYYDIATWNPGTSCIAEANNQSGNTACYTIAISSEPPALEVGGGYGQFNQANTRYYILNATARSSDSNGATVSMVQSTARKFDEN